MWDRAKPYKDQDYERLRKDCLSSGTVFEDPEFPAAPESLACSEEGAADGIEWKRPGVSVVRDLAKLSQYCVRKGQTMEFSNKTTRWIEKGRGGGGDMEALQPHLYLQLYAKI